jgi:hypothetical protein
MNCQGRVENWRGKFFLIFVSFLFSSLEVIRRKCKVSKVIISILFSLLFVIGFAQPEKRARIVETHNLEIIWMKTSPPDVWYLGSQLSSGDFNGDSFADIVITGDSLHGDTWTHKAYIFFGGPQFDTIPDVVIIKGFIRLKGIGDINDDGFDDLALGSPNSPYGRVYIYLGSSPMDTICDFEMKSSHDASAFGEAIGSGDVNGDNCNDLIIGAYTDMLRPGFFPGRIYIYFGGPNFDTIPDVILNGGHDGQSENFGITVGGGSDVNGDGIEDVIIGADGYGTSFWGDGRIYIYFGGNPMDTSYDVAMLGEGSNQSLGWYGVDFLRNNLTYDYAVTGCRFWPYGFPRSGPGKVYVLFGGNPMDSIPDVWMIGRTESSNLGEWTASAGDVNGDSCDDIISGAPIEYNQNGTAYLWLGGNLLDTIPDAWIRGMQFDDGIGWGVSSVDDVDGDNRAEIMVSNYASNQTPKRVWVCKYTGPGIGEERGTLNAIRLMPGIYPNPSRTHTMIRFTLNAKSKVTLKVYDIAGKIVKVLNVDKTPKSGQFEMKWDLRDNNQKKVTTGVYFIEISAGQEGNIIKEIRKITLIK